MGEDAVEAQGGMRGGMRAEAQGGRAGLQPGEGKARGGTRGGRAGLRPRDERGANTVAGRNAGCGRERKGAGAKKGGGRTGRRRASCPRG